MQPHELERHLVDHGAVRLCSVASASLLLQTVRRRIRSQPSRTILLSPAVNPELNPFVPAVATVPPPPTIEKPDDAHPVAIFAPVLKAFDPPMFAVGADVPSKAMNDVSVLY